MSPQTAINLQPWREPVTPSALKPMTAADAAGTRTAGQLKDLTFADYVVGAKNVEKTRHEQLVETTQKWVSQTFYGTILKQMRNSPFRSELFDGGRGGQAFGGLMDQYLADRMARSANNDLVNSIVRRIEARSAYGAGGQDNGSTNLGSGTDVTSTD